jgi:hypothetical protein
MRLENSGLPTAATTPIIVLSFCNDSGWSAEASSVKSGQSHITSESGMNKATIATTALLLLLSSISHGRADDNQAPAKSDESIGQAAAGAGRAVKDTAVDVGHAAKDAAVGVGHAAKDTALTVGRAAKDTAIKAGHAVRDAAKEVGSSVKTSSRDPAQPANTPEAPAQ